MKMNVTWRNDGKLNNLSRLPCQTISHMPSILLGSSVGIGAHCMLKCKIGKQWHAVTVHRIESSERVNYVPFEDDCREFIRRGLEFKYIPKRMLLTVTIRYRMLKNRGEVIDAFAARLATQDVAAYDNTWPLHYSTNIFNSNISSINLSTRMVLLNDGRNHSVQECINFLEQSYI
jgi:hypothetical protein